LITGKIAVGRTTPSFSLQPPSASWAFATMNPMVAFGDTVSDTTNPSAITDAVAGLAVYQKYAPSAPMAGFAFGIHALVSIDGGSSFGTVYALATEVFKTTSTALSGMNGNLVTLANIGGGTVTNANGSFNAISTTTTAGGAITTAVNVKAQLQVAASNSVGTGNGFQTNPIFASGATVTTYAAFRGLMSSVNAGATITNMYGLWIDKMVGGSTIQRAILTDGGTVEHKTGTATIIGLIIKGFTAQSANLQEWQDVSANILSTISENGYFTTRKVAAPADAELAASELAFWFDSTAGAAKLMIKAKNASGTVVTGNVALA